MKKVKIKGILWSLTHMSIATDCPKCEDKNVHLMNNITDDNGDIEMGCNCCGEYYSVDLDKSFK